MLNRFVHWYRRVFNDTDWKIAAVSGGLKIDDFNGVACVRLRFEGLCTGVPVENTSFHAIEQNM